MNRSMKATFGIKTMLGSLVFETSDGGRYAIATLLASNYKLRVRGGNANNTQQLGADIVEDNLQVPEAAGVVMRSLGLPHNEDRWCQILDVIQVHADERVMGFERRIAEQ